MNSLGRVIHPVARFCFTNRVIANRSIMTTYKLAEKAMENLKSNPYFDKYSSKIATLQQTSPEELLTRLEKSELERQKKQQEMEALKECSKTPSASSKLQTDTLLHSKPKTLSDVMKIELVEGKTAEEIEKIWHEYYSKKDGVAAVIPADNFKTIFENSKKYPLFLLPLPRLNGYEFIVLQFSGNEIHFTTLINYQTHQENSPECLTLVHYTDLIDSKGIVLMKGEFDSNVLTVTEAQCLASQIELYYFNPTESKQNILDTFTNNPMGFKHIDLVKELESISLVTK